MNTSCATAARGSAATLSVISSFSFDMSPMSGGTRPICCKCAAAQRLTKYGQRSGSAGGVHVVPMSGSWRARGDTRAMQCLQLSDARASWQRP